jgi:hypothetical protein
MNQRHSCDDVRFDVLLFGAEDSAEYQKSAGHVETCPGCQEELFKLAGDDGDWSQVGRLLRPDEFDGLAPPQSRGGAPSAGIDPVSANPAGRCIKFDFLAPPSHPEMLGRLGRYEIEQLIGAGGMGIVLKGFDTELNRPVAIKALAPYLAHSGAARQRFAREARAAAAVVHEHVVAIHNVESEHEVPFLVMQYVPGRSLQDRVDREGPLTPAEILRIGIQAAAGLAAAHAQGVIHRDVKPANILLENGVERTLLTDFGLARAADDATLTHSGVVAGTPHYMSPEQASGEPADARSDLFSLGSVLYFMATGRPPFRAEKAIAVLHRICHDRHRPVWEINSEIPDELSDVIDRLLEKKPSRRFATAREVQDVLATTLSRLQQSGDRRARRWFRRSDRRRRRLVAGAAGLALTIGGAVALDVWLGDARFGEENKHVARTAGVPAPAAELVAGELAFSGAFAKEVVEIERSLWRLESQIPPESHLLRMQNDPWLASLKAADVAIARQEVLDLARPNDNVPLDSVIGDKP